MITASQLSKQTIVAILRGAAPAVTLDIVRALHAGGIYAVEITLNSDNALGVIKQVSTSMGSTMLVGAGTVLNATEALAAIDNGAQFIISPSFDPATIHVTKAQGAVSIPGAYTATEIVNAYNAGADIVKVFPASNPQYIKDLRAPLAHIPMMPTGGVNVANIHAFRDAGAIAFGIGSALVDSKQPVTDAWLASLTEKARALQHAIS